jgi:hypothetical protein
MPALHMLLFKLPPLTVCLLMIAAAILFSVFGTLIFHRFVSHRSLKMHNDIAGPIFNTLGVVYAVLLGFVVVAVWENFDRTRLNVELEVNCLANLYIDSKPFETEFKGNVRTVLREYASATIDEWDVLVAGTNSPRSLETVQKLISLYSGYTPRNDTEKIFFAESIAGLNKLFDLRIHRLLNARTGAHPLLWFVLLTGGTVSIVFTIFFGTDRLGSKIVMTTLLAIVIALVLFTILEFSLPLTGFASVSNEPFRQFLARTVL